MTAPRRMFLCAPCAGVLAGGYTLTVRKPLPGIGRPAGPEKGRCDFCGRAVYGDWFDVEGGRGRGKADR